MEFSGKYKYNIENVPIDAFEYFINKDTFCILALSASVYHNGDFYMGYYKTYWVDRISSDHSSIHFVYVNKFKWVGFYEL